ncbi:MAG: TIGR02996 domain-containing protein [Gemmataceae bacterium]
MTNDSLFQAILDNPDDDTPRLVYADWLEENGDPDWAERIRIECELPTHEAEDIAPKLHELRKRREQLIRKHREAWKTHRYKSGRLLWQRGFLALEGSPESFLQPHAVTWWDQHKQHIGWVAWAGDRLRAGIAEQLPPDLVQRTAEIRRTNRALLRQNEINEIAHYANVRKLRCSYPGIRSKTAFAPLETMEQLRSLKLYSQDHFVSEPEAESLPAFPHLRQLHFEHGITGNAVRVLRKFKTLEELDLGQVFGLTTESWLQLESLTKLRKFRFFLNTSLAVHDPAPCVFPKWPNLRELSMRHWRTEEDVACLDQLPKLERLTLSATGSPSDSPLSLSALPTLTKLQCLHVHRNQRRLTGLGNLKQFPNLQELRLVGSEDQTDWDQLPPLPGLRALEFLNSYWAGLGVLPKQSAKIIVERCPNVERLTLPGSPGAAAIHALSKLKHVKALEVGYGRPSRIWQALTKFQGITYLKLPGSSHSENIGQHVKKFPALEILDLRGDWLARDHLQEIRKHCPKLVVLT